MLLTNNFNIYYIEVDFITPTLFQEQAIFESDAKPIIINGYENNNSAQVLSVVLYSCERWTLTAELQRIIQALQMRCCRTILGIFFTNSAMKDKKESVGRHNMPTYRSQQMFRRRHSMNWMFICRDPATQPRQVAGAG